MKHLRDLVTLKIDHNCLKQLNGVFEGFQNLEELDASYNFLESLSPSIGLMRKLIILRLDANRLNSIPIGIYFTYLFCNLKYCMLPNYFIIFFF